MDAIASQITSLTIAFSNVYSDADQRKHESSASQIFPFDDVIMYATKYRTSNQNIRYKS